MRRAITAAFFAASASAEAIPDAGVLAGMPVDAELPLISAGSSSSPLRSTSRVVPAVMPVSLGDAGGSAAGFDLQDPAAQCQWWFPDVGFEFDLSSIAGKLLHSAFFRSRKLPSSCPPTALASPLATRAGQAFTYTVSGAQKYLFSFCGNLTNNPCQNGVVAASIQLPPSGVGCLHAMGILPNADASLYSTDPTAGMVLTYRGIEPCGQFAGSMYTTTFTLLCDRTAGASPLTIVGFNDDECSLQYTIRTPAACPVPKLETVNPLGGGWIAFIVIVVLAAAYLVGGVVYKRAAYGATGIESVPNIDTWRAVKRTLCCENRRGAGSSALYGHAALEDADAGGPGATAYTAAPDA